MPAIEISPKAFTDNYIKPFASACISKLGPLAPPFQFAADGFFAAIAGLPFYDQAIDFDIPNPFPDLGGSGSGGGSGGPPNLLPPIPVLQPIDPQLAVTQIAEAVRAAEKILNSENLAIGGATAEINVVVSVGELAGANATLKINLGPTPRG